MEDAQRPADHPRRHGAFVDYAEYRITK
jgi:hypothetical protein